MSDLEKRRQSLRDGIRPVFEALPPELALNLDRLARASFEVFGAAWTRQNLMAAMAGVSMAIEMAKLMPDTGRADHKLLTFGALSEAYRKLHEKVEASTGALGEAA